jgi:murein DD-endopeptidase MepM/ murein hydrolase activator NlpD
LPVVCDFTEIFGVPYHTCIAEGYSDTELYIKNSWGTEWGQCGYNWSGLNPQLIRAYVAIPLDQDNNSSGYTGWIMLMPVDRCEVVQPYGKTPFALANPQLYAEFGGIHPGWDFNCPLGTPVYSSDNEDSVVISAGPSGGWGNLIKTQSGNRVLYYAHLNSIVVKVGDTIKRGQLLGYSGNTGNSTGPHLHFGIFLTDLNGFVDPSGYPISSYPR